MPYWCAARNPRCDIATSKSRDTVVDELDSEQCRAITDLEIDFLICGNGAMNKSNEQKLDPLRDQRDEHQTKENAQHTAQRLNKDVLD